MRGQRGRGPSWATLRVPRMGPVGAGRVPGPEATEGPAERGATLKRSGRSRSRQRSVLGMTRPRCHPRRRSRHRSGHPWEVFPLVREGRQGTARVVPRVTRRGARAQGRRTRGRRVTRVLGMEPSSEWRRRDGLARRRSQMDPRSREVGTTMLIRASTGSPEFGPTR